MRWCEIVDGWNEFVNLVSVSVLNYVCSQAYMRTDERGYLREILVFCNVCRNFDTTTMYE